MAELQIACECGHRDRLENWPTVGDGVVRCRRCRREFELGCNNVEQGEPPKQQRELDLK